jgi:hypothetical protein
VIDSRFHYKIKHVANGSTEKYKARFVARWVSNKRELIMMRLLLKSPCLTLLEPLCPWLLVLVDIYIKWMQMLRFEMV